jgi:hypothetical protein
MSPHDGGIKHLHQVSGLAQRRQGLKERLEHARPAQAPEPLPDRVPVAETLRQGPPGDVVNRKVMQPLKEAAVIAAFGTPPGARGGKHPQHCCPVFLRHSCQHGRAS